MLKAYLDSLDGIDSSLQSHYKPSEAEGGGFVLDAEGVEDVSGLRSALDNERKSNKEAKAFHKQHGTYDFGQIAALENDYKEKLASAAASGDQAKVDELKSAHDREKAAMGEGMQKERDAWDVEKVGYQTDFNEMMITKALAIEISGMAKNEHAAKLILGAVENDFEVVSEDGKRSVRVKDGNGGHQYTSGGGYKDIAARVVEMANEERFADLVKGSSASGSGAPAKSDSRGSGVKNNPWLKDSLNLTEQGRITTENPTLAKQLMAAAGK